MDALLILDIPLNRSIHVDDDIVVTVKFIGSNQVKLGVQAPAEVAITREELLDEHTYTSEGYAPE